MTSGATAHLLISLDEEGKKIINLVFISLYNLFKGNNAIE